MEVKADLIESFPPPGELTSKILALSPGGVFRSKCSQSMAIRSIMRVLMADQG